MGIGFVRIIGWIYIPSCANSLKKRKGKKGTDLQRKSILVLKSWKWMLNREFLLLWMAGKSRKILSFSRMGITYVACFLSLGIGMALMIAIASAGF